MPESGFRSRQSHLYHICILIFMSSRNIAVRQDVYEALRREQRGGESFTRVLDRLLHQRGPLERLAGSWDRRSAPTEDRWWREARGRVRGTRR